VLYDGRVAADDIWLLAEEGLEIGGDPCGPFAIRAMPCLRINKKPSTWNRGHDTVLVCAGEGRVVLAPYKQRRRSNPGKLFDVVVCEQAIECALRRRAGNFRLSVTIRSKNGSGRGRWAVLA
jgi:hypothetical protein